jgi:hypothetical protein
MLLFVTNYFAILLTGSFVFGVMGYSAAALQGSSSRVKRLAVAIVVVMILLIALPLGYTSFTTIRGSLAETRVASATEGWLEGSEYRFVSATADDQQVEVVIIGSGELPPQRALVESLQGQILGLAVQVEVLPSTTIEFETASP